MRYLLTGGSGFIGTNAIEALAAGGHEILDYSLDRPLNPEHVRYWHKGDILNREEMLTAFQKFQPDHVWHLAARADCDEKTTVETGYRANVEGTQNVLNAIRATPSIQRCVITSTQFVCGPGQLPKGDEDYFPATVYGHSKVMTEKLTRAANLPACWTIIRPTNVWGPWHMRYRREFWRVLQRGLYFHPGGKRVTRAYGYVKNVVYQVEQIFNAPRASVDGKTFYVGDEPADLLNWVNGFSRALTGRDVRMVPYSLMRLLAKIGDIPSRLTGRPFLINSSRLRSMTSDYDVPMRPTFAQFGKNPFPVEQGIAQTVQWLKSYAGPEHTGGGS